MRILFGLVFAASGFLLVFLCWRNRQSMLRSLAGEGTIEEILPGETPVLKVRYRDAAGRERIGTTNVVGRTPLRPEGKLKLRYDPDRPEWIAIEGHPYPYLIALPLGAIFITVGTLVLYSGIVELLAA